ncbi:unnamed protein product [Prorocentrum cordatum]|uniref:Uncharacterized protein n=1 Tax=Prorocentrum cordatum TaxID=2364126 RepID=A0ABN9PGP1_9DINO|nr:unnamed protein product [Polarella glacialis]
MAKYPGHRVRLRMFRTWIHPRWFSAPWCILSAGFTTCFIVCRVQCHHLQRGTSSHASLWRRRRRARLRERDGPPPRPASWEALPPSKKLAAMGSSVRPPSAYQASLLPTLNLHERQKESSRLPRDDGGSSR